MPHTILEILLRSCKRAIWAILEMTVHAHQKYSDQL